MIVVREGMFVRCVIILRELEQRAEIAAEIPEMAHRLRDSSVEMSDSWEGRR
jgi:hypothetical protein